MAPVAAAAYATIGATALLAVIIGAVGGAVLWRARHGLALGGLFVVGAFFVAFAAFIGFSWRGALVFGVIPLILTFLISFLAARQLRTRANFRPIWASLAALGTALILGLLYMLLFRIDPWVQAWVGAVLDVGLAWLAIRDRTTRPRTSGTAWDM